MDLTPLARLEQESGDSEPGGGSKGDRNSCSYTNDVPLYRRIGRKEASSNRSGLKSRY
jgi:hypothetical protein